MSEQAPVALISGGNSGIGRASALRFVRMGWRVALAARDEVKAAATLAEMQQPADDIILYPRWWTLWSHRGPLIGNSKQPLVGFGPAPRGNRVYSLADP